MKSSNYAIIVPPDLKPRPDKYEMMAAEICAPYFHSDMEFVLRGSRTTPDIRVLKTGQAWEIKSIRGNSKYTIRDNLKKASRQSNCVIISLLKPTTMTPTQAEARIRHFLATTKTKIQRVLLITKQKKVIDIEK